MFSTEHCRNNASKSFIRTYHLPTFPSHTPNQLSTTFRPLRVSAISPHTTEVGHNTSPRSKFLPESLTPRKSLPYPYALKTRTLHPATPSSPKKQRATQPKTTTTTTPISPTSVTPVAMLPSPTATSRRALCPR